MNANRQRPERPLRFPPQSWSRALSAVGLTATLLLAGCGGDAPTASPATPPPASPAAGGAAPISPPERPLFSGSVVWSIAVDPATGGPATPVQAVSADVPRLVAAIRVREGRSPGRVTAAWTYNTTPMPAFDAALDVPAGDGLAWAAFTLAMPDGETWPAGAYEIALSLDGGPPATGRIEVSPLP